MVDKNRKFAISPETFMGSRHGCKMRKVKFVYFKYSKRRMAAIVGIRNLQLLRNRSTVRDEILQNTQTASTNRVDS